MAYGFRLIADFGDSQQTAEFERNVFTALDRVSAQTAGRLLVGDIKRTNCTANTGQVLLYDPSMAGFTILLESPTPNTKGRLVVLKNTTSSTNTVTIRGVSGVKIDGAVSLASSTALASTTLVSDGVNYWKL